MDDEVCAPWDGAGATCLAVHSSVLGSVDEVALLDYTATMDLDHSTVLVDPGTDVYDDWALALVDADAPYPREYVVDADGIVRYTSDQIDVEAVNALIADLVE